MDEFIQLGSFFNPKWKQLNSSLSGPGARCWATSLLAFDDVPGMLRFDWPFIKKKKRKEWDSFVILLLSGFCKAAGTQAPGFKLSRHTEGSLSVLLAELLFDAL